MIIFTATDDDAIVTLEKHDNVYVVQLTANNNVVVRTEFASYARAVRDFLYVIACELAPYAEDEQEQIEIESIAR